MSRLKSFSIHLLHSGPSQLNRPHITYIVVFTSVVCQGMINLPTPNLIPSNPTPVYGHAPALHTKLFAKYVAGFADMMH